MSPGRGTRAAHLAKRPLVRSPSGTRGSVLEDAPNAEVVRCSRARRGAPAGRLRSVAAVVATGARRRWAAAAAPSNQPGGTSGVLDSPALDALQKRAAEVQSGLKAQQGEATAARDALAQAEQAVAAAQKVVDDAQLELAGYQKVVAGYASALYRDGGGLTPLTVLLSGGDPSEVLSAMSFLDVVDAHAAQVIGAAETMRQSALAVQQRARRRSTRRRRGRTRSRPDGASWRRRPPRSPTSSVPR